MVNLEDATLVTLFGILVTMIISLGGAGVAFGSLKRDVRHIRDGFDKLQDRIARLEDTHIGEEAE